MSCSVAFCFFFFFFATIHSGKMYTNNKNEGAGMWLPTPSERVR
jgi:hypothetical protein